MRSINRIAISWGIIAVLAMSTFVHAGTKLGTVTSPTVFKDKVTIDEQAELDVKGPLKKDGVEITATAGEINAAAAGTTPALTPTSVSGAAAADEVLAMGYTTMTTDTTMTDGGSYWITEGAAMTSVLPDPATILGETIRLVLVATSGGVTMNTHSNTCYFIAGDGDATDSSVLLDTAGDRLWLQAMGTVGTGEWGVLDQTGSPVYTTR